MRVIKAFAQEDREVDALPRPLRGRLPPPGRRDPAAGHATSRCSTSCRSWASRSCCSRAGCSWPTAPLTIGGFFQFNLYLGDARDAAAHGRHVGRPGAARGRVRQPRVRAARHRARRCRRPAHPTPLPAGGGELRLEGVRFGYDPERPILHEVDLDIPEGRTLALIGATGSGKSTLAALIPRLYDVRPGGCSSMASTCASSTSASCGARSRRSRRTRSCSRRPCATTSRSRGPMRATPTVEQAARRAQAPRLHQRAAEGLRHGHRRARPHALGRPAPAHRDRAGARRRPAHPDPRRRHRLGRRDDRGAHPRRPARGDGGAARR